MQTFVIQVQPGFNPGSGAGTDEPLVDHAAIHITQVIKGEEITAKKRYILHSTAHSQHCSHESWLDQYCLKSVPIIQESQLSP